MTQWLHWLPLPATDEDGNSHWIQPSAFQDSVLLRPTSSDEVREEQDPLFHNLLELAKQHGMKVLHTRQHFDYPKYANGEFTIRITTRGTASFQRSVCEYLLRASHEKPSITGAVLDILKRTPQHSWIGDFAFILLHSNDNETDGGRLALLDRLVQHPNKPIILPSNVVVNDPSDSQGSEKLEYSIIHAPMMQLIKRENEKHALAKINKSEHQTILEKWIQSFGMPKEGTDRNEAENDQQDTGASFGAGCNFLVMHEEGGGAESIERLLKDFVKEHQRAQTSGGQTDARFQPVSYALIQGTADSFSMEIETSLPPWPHLLDVLHPSKEGASAIHMPRGPSRRGPGEDHISLTQPEDWECDAQPLLGQMFKAGGYNHAPVSEAEKTWNLILEQNAEEERLELWRKACAKGDTARRIRVISPDAMLAEATLLQPTKPMFERYLDMRDALPKRFKPLELTEMMRGHIALGDSNLQARPHRKVFFQLIMDQAGTHTEKESFDQHDNQRGYLYGKVGNTAGKRNAPDTDKNSAEPSPVVLGYQRNLWNAHSESMPLWISRSLVAKGIYPLTIDACICTQATPETTTFLTNRIPAEMTAVALGLLGQGPNKQRTLSLQRAFTNPFTVEFLLDTLMGKLEESPGILLDIADGIFHTLIESNPGLNVEQRELKSTLKKLHAIMEDLGEEDGGRTCQQFRSFLQEQSEGGEQLSIEEEIDAASTLPEALKKCIQRQKKGKAKHAITAQKDELFCTLQEALADLGPQGYIYAVPNPKERRALVRKFSEEEVRGSNMLYRATEHVSHLIEEFFKTVCEGPDLNEDRTLDPSFELLGRTVLCRAIAWYNNPLQDKVQMDLHTFAKRVVNGLRFKRLDAPNPPMFPTTHDVPLVSWIRSKAFGWSVSLTDKELCFEHHQPSSRENMSDIVERLRTLVKYQVHKNDVKGLEEDKEVRAALDQHLNNSFRFKTHDVVEEWLDEFYSGLLGEDTDLLQTLDNEKWKDLPLARAEVLVDQFKQRYANDEMHEVQQAMLDILYAGRGCSIQDIAVRAMDMPFASHTMLPILQHKRAGFQSFADLTGTENHDVASNHRKSIGNVLWIHPWSSASGRSIEGMRLHAPETSSAQHWHGWLLDSWKDIIKETTDCSHVTLPACVRIDAEDGDDAKWSNLVMHKLHLLYVVAYAKYLYA